MKRSRKEILTGIIFQVFLFALGFVMIYPILWMVANSFKTAEEIFGSASLIPEKLLFDNYQRGWRYVGSLTFATFFKNSFIYAGIATVGVVFSSALVAFGFSRIRFKGRNLWFGVMILTMIIPYQVIMVPQFIIFQKLGWINTFLPLIVPMCLGYPFFIFLMVQFIRGIPISLDESAWMDGCGRFMIFSRIIFPLMKPAIITTTIFSFYWRWEDFLGPLLYLNKPRLFTVSLALRMFSDPMTSTDWGAIFAMGTLSLVPVLVIFVSFQKYLSRGIATTGIKG
ncbi:carbohydrate ABC transporter permease [Marispirochaeta sp.]|jgi:multiple sugar transport system permease protein|uniref:carbohydrate ABC transporter permease n=1 Tax=Marispirochaeta sp. TaxID=2038653 RepID=UPI0029C66C49|nr:carbohydrate ABC transporter permease [Marispirochaeta sp.]